MAADETTIQSTDPRSLAALMRLEGPDWQPADLAAMLDHQLRSPLVAELSRVWPSRAGQLQEMAEGCAPAVRSFADLLTHPNPPLALLRLTKDFAKRSVDPATAGADLPTEVATVLYYSAIAAGLVRLGQRITALDEQGLRAGLDWALAQTWVKSPLRELLQQV